MMQRINFQPISKIERGDGQTLLIHSVFPTIQGEGPNVGMPAVFLRLGGCNLQCPGCDTEYTSGAANEPIESILTRIRMAFGDRRGSRLVVITGGEPLRQNLGPLIHQLHESYIQVQIETNGTCSIDGIDDWTRAFWSPLRPQIVVSPKAGKVHLSLFPYIAAYKYVLDAHHVDPDDGLPESVLGMPGRPARPHEGYDGPVYVQPADEMQVNTGWAHRGNNQLNLAAAIDSAMKYGYRLCLQTHKIAGLD